MRTLVVIAALATAGLALAQDEKQIQDAIKGLGAESFEEREKATADLKKIGAPALEALKKAAADSDDPEVRVRAKRLVDAIQKPAEKPKQSAPGRSPLLSRATIRQDKDGTVYSLNPPDGDAIELHRGTEGGVKLVYPDGKGGKAQAESDTVEKFVAEHKELAEKYGITKDGIDYGGTRLSFNGVLRAIPALPPMEWPMVPQAPEFKDFDEFFKQSDELRKAFEDLRRWRGRELPGFGAWGIQPDVRGAQFGAVPEVLRSQLSIPEGQGVVVEAVREGSVAGAAGLKKHDVVLEIDGKKVTGPADLRTLTRESKVKALRGGKEQMLEPAPARKKEF